MEAAEDPCHWQTDEAAPPAFSSRPAATGRSPSAKGIRFLGARDVGPQRSGCLSHCPHSLKRPSATRRPPRRTRSGARPSAGQATDGRIQP